VGIARALISDPDIVFADEPHRQPRQQNVDEVMRLSAISARERGKTLIMVTHDPNMAALRIKLFICSTGRLRVKKPIRNTQRFIKE
jgi:putative ABC transport system ATP-binding protein